ncbi:MAG TPA: diphthamide biosynthesis enzyme Dph2 [archaeon]|nr:diphthamide biosynthesis enzyme Dph2 [archaeon]
MKAVVKELKKLNAKKIFVQFPEGIKLRIQDIKRELEKEGFDIALCLERTWGACDIREYEAKMLGCDAIVHVAHRDFGVKSKIPIVYWDYFQDVDPIPALEKELDKLKDYKNIGLVASLQFIPVMKTVKKYLEDHGKKVFSGKTEEYEGQILGCRVGAGKLVEDKVDCFLCVSAGKFYPLGLALDTGKRVFNFDLEEGKIFSMDEMRNRVLKVIAWNKAEFKDAKKVGLLVSFKTGQFRNPFSLKKIIEKQGKEVFVLAMDEFSMDKLEGLKLDVLVNTACPRIIDDFNKYKIPIINIEDALNPNHTKNLGN